MDRFRIDVIGFSQIITIYVLKYYKSFDINFINSHLSTMHIGLIYFNVFLYYTIFNFMSVRVRT